MGKWIFRVAAPCIALVVLTACGGGGGGDGSPGSTGGAPSGGSGSTGGSGGNTGGSGGSGGQSSYTVGGTLSGLSGSGLVLQNSGGNNLPVSANGTFTFSTAVAAGGPYAITVLTQPSAPSQTCTVANGAGTMGSANVTNVAISCATNSYTIGGAVSGLTSSGLTLQNNGGNDLSVAADGTFTFSSLVASGSNYSVSISAQPTGQSCAVSSGSGAVGSAAVTNVTVACRALVGKFLYVPNSGSDDVSTYSIDPSSGALAAVGSAPVAADKAPLFAAAGPAEKFLYVTNQGSASVQPTVSIYSMNSATGALTEIADSPSSLSVSMPPPNGPADINPVMLHPSGKFGYITSGTASTPGTLYGATIDSGSGDLREITGMPVDLGIAAGFGAFDAAGKYLYVPYNHLDGGTTLTGYIASFQVDASGGLTAAAPVATGGTLSALVQRDPSGKFLMAPNQHDVGGSGNGSVAVFSIDANSGALSAVTGSPFAMTGPPISLSFHPTKNFVYVLINPVASHGTLATYQLDATSGALSPAPGSPVAAVGTSPGFAWIEPTGKFLLISNRGSNNIQSFSIDQTTGALTEVAGSPFATGASPTVLTPDPSGKYFYSANAGASTVSSYSLNMTTGAVAVVSTVPAGTSPRTPTLVGRQ